MSTEQWDLFKGLKFELHAHIVTVPQVFRAERWYVLKNELTGEFTRLNQSAYRFIGQINHQQTLEQYIEFYNETNTGKPISQTDAVETVQHLLSKDILKLDKPLDAVRQQQLNKSRNRNNSLNKFGNPLALKFKLCNPDSLLTRLNSLSNLLFTKYFVTFWAITTLFGLLVANNQKSEIYNDLNSDLLSPQNIMVMIFLFMIIKLFHELGHAFSIKYWGGRVKEIGITFLVFNPVPYVDATDSWSFQNKYKRVIVSAMGILVELFIASIAIMIWSISDPGLLKSTALNCALVASVSTLLFNANPLLKFDGYYVLQDLIEIPNLSKRSNSYLVYLLKRYLLGITSANSPVTGSNEYKWFFSYGVLALAYRVFLLTVITLFLMKNLFILGILIGIWAIYIQVLRPIIHGISFLKNSPEILDNKKKHYSRIAAATLVLILFIGVLPFPNTTYTQGSIWINKQSQVYSTQDGYIAEVAKTPGSNINTGDVLIRLENPLLDARIEKLDAKKREISIQINSELLEDLGKSNILLESLNTIEYELDLLRKDMDKLTIKAESNGIFHIEASGLSKGRFLKRGEFIGYVFSPEKLIVQTVIAQDDIGKIQNETKTANIRLAEQIDKTYPISINREYFSSTSTLPNKALGASGGGTIVVHQTNGNGTTANQEYFRADFVIPDNHEIQRLGGIVHLRFIHDATPLSMQLLRSMKHVFSTGLTL